MLGGLVFAYPLLSVYSQQGQDIWPDYFLRCGWVPNNIWSPGLNSSSSSPRPYSHDLATFVFEVHAMYSRVAHFSSQIHKQSWNIDVPHS